MWCEPPRELGENFVLLIGPRELGVGARLTVIIPQVLVAREEPEPIAIHGTAEIRREVAVSNPLVAACWLASILDWKYRRLAGQRRRLPVVRRVVEETVAPLPGDNVDDGALDVAVLGRRTH